MKRSHPVPCEPLTIVEGSDGSGKTTLIEAFKDYLPEKTTVVHHGAYLNRPTVMNYYTGPMLQVDHNLLFDRSWLSEPIYATVMRGGANRVPPWCRRMLERIALTRAGAVVVCLRPWEAVLESYQARRGEEYVKDEVRMRAVFDAYVNLEKPTGPPTKLFATQLPTIVVDPTQTDVGTIMERLESARGNLNRGPGIGAWKPGRVVLMVGDRVSQRGRDGLPFISGLTTGCSSWLASQLDAARLGEHQLYWINGFSKTGEELNGAFVERLNPVAVVAMGKEAKKWTDRNVVRTIPRFHVPHPQYWKRFHTGRAYPIINIASDLRRDGYLGDI